ncbi:MAG: PDZ domain-containing protein [Acidobacteriota bacterium]
MKKTALWVAVAATGAALAATAQANDDRSEVRVRVVEKGPCPTVEWEGDESLGLKVSKRGFLGVEITSLTPDLRRHFGVSDDEGVMIGKIVDDSAAQRAGLAVGDIVTRVDGRTIEGAWDLTAAIRESEGGDTVMVEYWRDGQVNQQSVTLDARETCTFDMSSVASSLEELKETLPGLHMRGLAISEGAMEEVMESLRDIDWEEHLGRFEAIHVEGLEERMKELEVRMEELGDHLELNGEHIEWRKIQVLEGAERDRIEHEIEVRTELNRARIEARRRAEEMAIHRVEARQLADEMARAAERTRAEAEALIEEAERTAEEGGGGPF